MLVFVHAYCIITQVSMYALESNKLIIKQNQTLIRLIQNAEDENFQQFWEFSNEAKKSSCLWQLFFRPFVPRPEV